ncbi:MAG: NAD-dependent epimerase/dehydratase family protein, partial [Proteobacteria bacterium]
QYDGPSLHFLVTGATGFVGQSLCTLLTRNGHKVTAVSRAEISQTGVEKYIIKDWKDAEEWSSVLRNVDVVIHLAARVHVMNDKSVDPLSEFRDANLENTRVLASAVLKSEVKKFIFLSSILVNGTSTGNMPYRPVDEPMPGDPYSISKLETEIFLKSTFEKSPIDLVTIRPPLIYGPGCRGNFLRLLNLARNLPIIPLGGFRNQRSMIFVENLSDFIHKVAVSPSKANLYLVSDAKDLGLAELVEKLGTYMGSPGKVVFFPKGIIRFVMSALSRNEEFHKVASDLVVDASEARNDFQWLPPYTVEEGLKATVDWHSSLRNRI